MHPVDGERDAIFDQNTRVRLGSKTVRGGKSKEEEEKADVCSVIQEAVRKINSPLFAD